MWRAALLQPGEATDADLMVAVTPLVRRSTLRAATTAIAVPLDRIGDWVADGLLDIADEVVATTRVRKLTIKAAWSASMKVAVIGEAPESFDRLVEIATTHADRPKIGITTCVRHEGEAEYWGDTHFARGLGRGFSELGASYADLITPEWNGEPARSCSATVHLRGLEPRQPLAGKRNALWFISHPDRMVDHEFDGFDVIASASATHAAELEATLGRKILYLPQATDPQIFRIGPRVERLAADVLVVANARWPHRRAIRWLHKSGIDFHLYGRHWRSAPEAVHLRGEHVPNGSLAELYRSASIVVADHHPDMRKRGFVANRIFDVLACGGFVISDDVAGLRDLIGDAVPVYRSMEDLVELIRHFTADPAERRRLSSMGRSAVMESHTFRHRAARLMLA
jgi:glycosyltransferase involved in cell wall biosynthesis